MRQTSAANLLRILENSLNLERHTLCIVGLIPRNLVAYRFVILISLSSLARVALFGQTAKAEQPGNDVYYSPRFAALMSRLGGVRIKHSAVINKSNTRRNLLLADFDTDMARPDNANLETFNVLFNRSSRIETTGAGEGREPEVALFLWRSADTSCSMP